MFGNRAENLKITLTLIPGMQNYRKQNHIPRGYTKDSAKG